MTILNTILLQQAQQGGLSGMMNIVFIVAIIVVFYFFMIRPQSKRQKEIKKAREAMTKGDKIVTAGGIYGRIREIGDTWFMIEISEGVRIKIDKGSVYPSAEDATAAVGQK